MTFTRHYSGVIRKTGTPVPPERVFEDGRKAVRELQIKVAELKGNIKEASGVAKATLQSRLVVTENQLATAVLRLTGN